MPPTPKIQYVRNGFITFPRLNACNELDWNLNTGLQFSFRTLIYSHNDDTIKNTYLTHVGFKFYYTSLILSTFKVYKNIN